MLHIKAWQALSHLTAAMRRLSRPGSDERGATMVEYALLVALISVVAVAAVALIGTNASAKFSSVGSTIQ
jgi:pilus assembly protein Flp/PilA